MLNDPFDWHATAKSHRGRIAEPAVLGAVMSGLAATLALSGWFYAWLKLPLALPFFVMGLVAFFACVVLGGRYQESVRQLRDLLSEFEGIRQDLKRKLADEKGFTKIFKPSQQDVEKELIRRAACVQGAEEGLRTLFLHGIRSKNDSRAAPQGLDMAQTWFEEAKRGHQQDLHQDTESFKWFLALAESRGYKVRACWQDYANPSNVTKG